MSVKNGRAVYGNSHGSFMRRDQVRVISNRDWLGYTIKNGDVKDKAEVQGWGEDGDDRFLVAMLR